MNKTILVTGGAGFIGSNLIEKLIQNNYDTISIDNYSTGSTYNHIKGCNYIKYDLSKITYDLPKVDFIFHLAATARIQPSFSKVDQYFSSNIVATHNVVSHATKTQCPIVYTGSSSHHSGRFSNPYTFTKDIGEDIIKLYQDHFNLRASIARLYNVYGPRESISKKYATLIGSFKQARKNNEPLIIYGDGSKRRDFTNVSDIVDGLYLIMIKEYYGHIFELGYGKNYSVKEIAEMFKYNNIEYKENRYGEATETLCNNSLAKTILGWNPTKNIEDYIKELITNE